MTERIKPTNPAFAEFDKLANASRRAEREIYSALVGPRLWPGEITAAFVDAQNALHRLRNLSAAASVSIVLTREAPTPGMPTDTWVRL